MSDSTTYNLLMGTTGKVYSATLPENDTYSNVSGFVLDAPHAKGDAFTLSFDVRLSAQGLLYAYLYNAAGDTHKNVYVNGTLFYRSAPDGHAMYEAGPEWRHVAITWEYAEVPVQPVDFIIPARMFRSDTAVGTTVEVRNLMLVRGAEPAAWAPAEGEELAGGGAQMSANLWKAENVTPAGIPTDGIYTCSGTRGVRTNMALDRLATNQTFHCGFSVNPGADDAFFVALRYRDAAGNVNYASTPTASAPAGKWTRVSESAVVPSGMAVDQMVICNNGNASGANGWKVTNPCVSYGSPVTLVSSAHTPYATQDHLRSEYATKAALKAAASAALTDAKAYTDSVEVGGRNLLKGSMSVSTAPMTHGWCNNYDSPTVELVTLDGKECIHFSGSPSGTTLPSIRTRSRVLLEWDSVYVMTCDMMFDKEILIVPGAPQHYHAGSVENTDEFNLSVLKKGGGVVCVSRSPEEHEVIAANTWTRYTRVFKTDKTAPRDDYPYPTIAPFIYGDVRTVSETTEVNGWMRNFKIEKGTKATDWTPAPEDTDFAVADAKKAGKDAQAAASAALENAETNATAIADETTRATQAEQTNATAISNETTRAKEAEQANSTAISNEITRATDAENTLSNKIDTNKADLAAIKSTRNDFYDPNTNINKYASYRNEYSQNNEYVQGMAISGNTLYIGAAPINGGVSSVYRYPNFHQNVEDLPSDARVVLNKSKNSHANDIEVFDGILYITDGGINNANASKIARVDAKTFEELEPLTLWYGGITDICIVQAIPDANPNFVYIYGSSYDTQEVYTYQAYYDFSTKQMNVYPNVMKAGQFQPYNNRQAATHFRNTRIFLYSGQNGTNNDYKASTYIISSNPAQGTQGCVATIPWTGEAEGLAIFDNQLLFNSGNSIYSVGPVINFMNQLMNYSLMNRGYETNALAHIVTDCTALLNAPADIGYMYYNRYRNGSAGIITMFVYIPGHQPLSLPIPLSRTISDNLGAELSVSSSKYYAGSQTLVTYIFYYKFTNINYMLQFQLTAVHAFTLTNNTTHNEYKNYADIPETIKPTKVYIDYQDVN